MESDQDPIPERYAPLPETAVVFRLALRGHSFLPAGQKYPNHAIWVPSSADKDEARETGRPAGVSVWNREYTTDAQAHRLFSDPEPPPEGLEAFDIAVASVRRIASEHKCEMEVVADPLPVERGPGSRGHSLVEGLERKKGADRTDHKRMLDALLCAFIDPAASAVPAPLPDNSPGTEEGRS